MKPVRSKNPNHEKGQSLIELALGMIIFLILLSGIVDLGRAIFTLFAMQDAAEEGIVYGTSFPTDCDQIQQRVDFNLSNQAITGGMTILAEIERNNGTFTPCDTIPLAEVYAGKELRVEVTKTFQITMPFLGTFIGQTIPLKATANGIILRPQPPAP